MPVMEAEFIAAVIFHIQCMRSDPSIDAVSFDGLRDRICESRKSWLKPDVVLKVAATIKNLQDRKWIRIDP